MRYRQSDVDAWLTRGERDAAQTAATSPEERKAVHRAKNERAKANRQAQRQGD